jgi:Alginate export
VSIGGASLSLLAVKPVQPGLGSLDDRRSLTKSLWGAYATFPGLDIYYLGYRNNAAKFGGRAGRELRHSIGARSFGTSNNWHWNIEGVAQFGEFAGGSIGAWTLGTEIGRHFPKTKLAPDIALRFNIVSGDTNPSDNQLGTFNALFPKGKYFGELSPVGPYNIVSFNPRVTMALSKTVTMSLAGMAYWRYSRSDGIYDVPGNLIRPPGDSRSRLVGKEVEVTLAWQVTPELELSGSLSAFSPGAYIAETGSAKPIVLLGFEGKFRF